MDGIHDLGGMQGFGPIDIAHGDRGFAEIPDWEQRMWALARSGLAPDITIDWFRHTIERMVPADYLRFGYFNKWCTTYLLLLIDNGTITLDEACGPPVADPRPTATPRDLAGVLQITRASSFSFEVPTDTRPAFAEGAQVCTLPRIDHAHTRLPRYARDKSGTVLAYRGHHVLPDEGAKGHHTGDHLYTVLFTAPELWGPDADPRDTVTLELWESYLVPA